MSILWTREGEISDSGQVRAVERAFRILQAINTRDGAKAAEIAASTGIPRPTVYRLLEELVEGYAAPAEVNDVLERSGSSFSFGQRQVPTPSPHPPASETTGTRGSRE